MNTITSIILLAVCAATVTAMNPGDFEVCSPRYSCKQLRGLILFDYNILSPYQQYLYGGRQWEIRPPTDSSGKTSVTMVFKNFHITSKIYVIMDMRYAREIKPDTRGQFELVAANVTSITIHVPREEKGNFQAFYYAGCTVLTSASAEIEFPLREHIVGLKSTCWIIKPMAVQDKRRVYVTMRDVYLTSGAKIRIEDLNSNMVLAEVNESMSYEVYGADTYGTETLLVDLECGGEAGTCDGFGNLFSLSYYAVTTRDVACIETQKKCALYPTKLPSQLCRQDCPMLEHIIEEEFEKELEPFFQMPVLKSATLVGTVKETESVEEHGNRTQAAEEEEGEEEEREEEEEEEAGESSEEEGPEEEEEEEGEVDRRITQRKPITPAPKRMGCLLNKKYCKCLRTLDDARQYCFSRRKCSSYVLPGCCIYVRIQLCLKIRSTTSVSMFGSRAF